MREQSRSRDRRAPLAAAAVGGVLLGLLLLRGFSTGGRDVGAGAPPGSAPQAATTTLTLPSPAPASDLLGPVDPFGQLVTIPQAASGAEAVPDTRVSRAAQSAAPSTTQTTRAAPSTQTTRTTAPPATEAPQPILAAPSPQPTAPAPAPMPGPALASAMAGPAAVPGSPVQICINNGTASCMSTPAATSVSLYISATVDPAATSAPTLVSGACSNGQGVAIVVNTGSAGTTITGTVIATVGGSATAFAVGLPSAAPNQTVIVSACVPPGVGAPAPPGGAPAPLITAIGGLLQGALGLLGLLGGGGAAPTP